MMDFAQLIADHPILTGSAALAVGGYLVSVARKIPAQVLSHALPRLITSVEIPDRDPAFRWLEKWLAAHPEAHRSRAYTLLTEQGVPTAPAAVPAAYLPASQNEPGDGAFRFVFTPAPGAGLARFRGHRLWIERRRRHYETAFNGAPHSDRYLITHLGPASVIEELLSEALKESLVATDAGVPVLVAGCGQWGHQGFKGRRPVESVMLDTDILDELVDDMETFYRSDDWYRDRGIPWHRGYLFAGVPGSGKTSLAMVLAGKLRLNIAIVSLASNEMDDQALARLMIALPKRSLLLIEDVDALFNERESKCRVTFAGFLNSLDGIAATDGRILVMTTNHPEKLDPALVRPGRVDRRVDFGHATPNQARRLFLWFFRDSGVPSARLDWLACDFGEGVPPDRLSMAAIQEHLLRHRDSPEEACRTALVTSHDREAA